VIRYKCFAFAALPLALFAQEVVQTRDGAVRGVAVGAVMSFRAIPYAQPPVGGLRWRSPRPPEPRAETLDATRWGPLCPQVSGERVTGEEDCLHLNIWTPEPRADSPAPVMVWIHGGGHVQGGAPMTEGGVRIYDGARLSEVAGAVVVTINYRLGPLGFLALPELSTEEGSSGNLGTLDQIAALEWVRDNIASFGGDPKRVMIFGESAGGVAVCALMTSPRANGLFHSAAMQSGACTARSLASAEAFGRKLAEAAGCGADTAECLRRRTPNELLEAIPPGFNISTESSDYGSVVDGIVQPQAPLEVIARGEHARVPVIVGANSDETSRSVPPIRTEAEYVALVRRQFPGATLSSLILAEYPVSEYKSPQAAFVALTSDSRFICQARRAVVALRGAQEEPVFRYFFTHGPENASPSVAEAGAWHGLDVLYLFQKTEGIIGYRPGAKDRAVEQAFASYWASLAAAGHPNGGVLLDWPRSDDADSYLELASPLRTGQGVRTRQCDFWDRLFALAQ
jgi:para-nitrobenzyl esterase